MKGKFLLATLALLGATSMEMKAQEESNKIGASLGAEITSQYIWRGQNLGDVSLQPTLGLDWKGLSLSAFGSVGISNWEDTKELDFTLAYEYKWFHVGITDYWFNSPNDHYFQYKAHETSHVFEGNVGVDFGFLSFDWYTNFAGNDGVTDKGKRAYSSYFELSAPFRLAHLDWKATLGVVPYETSFYAEAGGFAVTNVAVQAEKTFSVKDKVEFPVHAAIIANPSTEKLYFVVGAAFSI